MITPMEELRRRNDAYINNMLLQPAQHSKEHLQAASIIFAERGLADPAKQELIKQYPAIRKDAIQQYRGGMTKENLINYLMTKGISNQDANEMTKNAMLKDAQANEIEQQEKSNKSFIIPVMLFLAYIIFKIIIRMNR